MLPQELRDLDAELARLLGWTDVDVVPGTRWDLYRGHPPLVTGDEGRTIPLPYWSLSNAAAVDLLDDITTWGCDIETWNYVYPGGSYDRKSGRTCTIRRGVLRASKTGATYAEAVTLAAKAFLEAVNKTKETNDVETIETIHSSPEIP